jgi:hypothetical protein
MQIIISCQKAQLQQMGPWAPRKHARGRVRRVREASGSLVERQPMASFFIKVSQVRVSFPSVPQQMNKKRHGTGAHL